LEKVEFRAKNKMGGVTRGLAEVYLTNMGERERVLHVEIWRE
jgi:hypothetical protein